MIPAISTSSQGRSGLGLEAQQSSVRAFCHREGLELIEEVVEVESGKGWDALALRPKLNQAFTLARQANALVVVAKLDRLTRYVSFVTSLMTHKALCRGRAWPRRRFIDVANVRGAGRTGAKSDF